ncbi:uncharacterized protein JN550_011552 [Neoarthrinium moseri]|uniref:uncharacterized protein n=1 Tax=Neoarthrinium moseri TaxID=1658444 RepID=UPI001FDB75FB|nr:uncharacterized protein JN550_011552 [Neoarthrinium moseri]KAI1860400.1 hypothetical protein JN550_011552 [Neoarthrinium moseri]
MERAHSMLRADQPDTEMAPRQRRRPVLSCRECRRRKIKCDHNNPCAGCVQYKRRCTYQRSIDEPNKRASGLSAQSPPLSPAPSQLNPPGRREPADITPCTSGDEHSYGLSSTHYATASLHALPLSSAAVGVDRQLVTEQAHNVPSVASISGGHDRVPWNRLPSQPVREHSAAAGPYDHLHRSQSLAGSAESVSRGSRSSTLQAPSRIINENGNYSQQSSVVTQEWQVVLNKTRDLGKNRTTGTAPELSSIISCYGEITGKDSGNVSFQQPEVAQLITQAAGFLGQCKNAAKGIKIGRPTRGLQPADIGLALPPRQTADAMVKLYFTAFESTHRILHTPSFWTEYRIFWEQPESTPLALRLKVLLAVSIGSSLYDHGAEDAALSNIEMVHHRIYDAEIWLAGPLEKDRLSIAGLQIYCLTILARQIFSIGGDTIWASMGSLIHTAMQLGLHRDPQHLPPMSSLQAELRRRLWATILDFVVQSALDSRMPPRISVDEFDTGPPLNVNDDEIDESIVMAQSHSTDTFTATSVQICLFESLPVRLSIVQALSNLQRELTYNHALHLSSRLTDAIQTSHYWMERTSGATLFHKNMLDYLIRRFMIPLHYSFSNQTRENRIYYYSLKLSVDAGIALISPEGSDAGPDAHFSKLMAMGGGLFREGIRSAMSAVTLNLLVLAQEQHLEGTMRRNFQSREVMKQAVKDLVKLSEERIRSGETNVKSHMFLKMILAQVGALENGKPVELEVARAARDSLEFCLGLLKTRAAHIDTGSPFEADLMVAGMDMGQGLGSIGLDLYWESVISDMGF